MEIIDASPSVYLVDDDPHVSAALSRGLTAQGFRVRCWQDADAFLAGHDPAAPGCVVADIAMPGTSGLELQARLSRSGSTLPIIFVTGQGSIAMSVQAMRAGAVTFLPKPVRLDDLTRGIGEALERDRELRAARRRQDEVNARLRTLTPRENEVLRLVTVGRLNKQIAAELGAAEKTIKVHRGRVMAKMGTRSVAELVRLTHL